MWVVGKPPQQGAPWITLIARAGEAGPDVEESRSEDPVTSRRRAVFSAAGSCWGFTVQCSTWEIFLASRPRS